MKTEIKQKKRCDRQSANDLPTDLTQQPNVKEFDFSEMPIMYVNVSGEFDGMIIEEVADKMQTILRNSPK